MSEQAGGLVPALGFYEAETERLRSTARWLTTALGAVAVVLVGGLQLSGLGTLSVERDLGRLAIAVVALGAALLAVGSMIHETVPVFTSRWLDLRDVQRREFLEQYLQHAPVPCLRRRGGQSLRRRGRPPDRAAYAIELLDDINRLGPVLYHHVAPTISDLQQQVAAANTAAVAALESGGAGEARTRALQSVQQTREAAHAVVVYANYVHTRRQHDVLAPRLVWLGCATAVAVAVFAYAVTPA